MLHRSLTQTRRQPQWEYSDSVYKHRLPRDAWPVGRAHLLTSPRGCVAGTPLCLSRRHVDGQVLSNRNFRTLPTELSDRATATRKFSQSRPTSQDAVCLDDIRSPVCAFSMGCAAESQNEGSFTCQAQDLHWECPRRRWKLDNLRAYKLAQAGATRGTIALVLWGVVRSFVRSFIHTVECNTYNPMPQHTIHHTIPCHTMHTAPHHICTDTYTDCTDAYVHTHAACHLVCLCVCLVWYGTRTYTLISMAIYMHIRNKHGWVLRTKMWSICEELCGEINVGPAPRTQLLRCSS